jgi:hypothetical protein
MALTTEQIDSIERSINVLHTAGQPLISGLRELFPGVVFVRCDAGDMEGPPYRSGEHHRLYLLDRSEVCIRMTDQIDSADGVVIAEVN